MEKVTHKIKKRIYGYIHRFINLKHIKVVGGGKLYTSNQVKFCFDKNSRFNYTGKCILDDSSFINNKRSSLIYMYSNSIFEMNNCRIYYGADIKIKENAFFSIGENTFINCNCKIEVYSKIIIGNNCAISYGFTALDSDGHKYSSNPRKGIIIGDNVWIGANVTILKGVEIGEGSIIAAGTVLTKSVPPFSLVAGVPGKIKKGSIKWEK